MEYSFLYQQLESNAVRIAKLAWPIAETEARWKPDPTSWSILEVINHLYDEEREDFRVRLDIILHHPELSFPLIDPEGWVIARKYNERDLEKSLENYLSERHDSLARLQTLEQVDWRREYRSHSVNFRAGDMFASWVKHDLLHMRQIVEIRHALVVAKARPFNLEYAGKW